MAPIVGPLNTSSSSKGRVVAYDEVVRAAIRLLVGRGEVDMRDLAEALAVSRATLYRVIDGQDELLGDVLWALTDRTIAMAEREAQGDGAERLLDLSSRFHAMVRAFEPLRRLADTQPDRMFRVLFTPVGRVHERTVGRWTEMLETAVASGELTLPFDGGQFAEMFVRLGESMLWSDLLGAGDVDVDAWDTVRRSLFRLER